MSNIDRILKLAGFEQEAQRTTALVDEAAGEFAAPIFDLCDDLGCEIDHPVFAELVRYLSSDQVEEFVADFRRHHDMDHSNEDEEYSDDDANFESKEESVNEAEVDKDAVRELVLYAKNDGDLYNQSTAPIQKNLSKKFTKGTYDHGKAVVLWKYHADRAAKKYGVDFGDDGFRIFSPAVRKAAAKEFADAWQMELEAGNMGEGNEFSGALANAKKDGKKEFEVDGKPYKVEEDEDIAETCGKCGCDPEDPTPGCDCDSHPASVNEAPTMNTTQLITLLKNSGFTAEAIEKKLTEWANTPEGVGEVEPTSHGDAYDFAQRVNLSLKRYLNAEDAKVQVAEGYTVEALTDLYNKKKLSVYEEVVAEDVETETVETPVGERPKGIGWVLKRSGEQRNEPNDVWTRKVKKV